MWQDILSFDRELLLALNNDLGIVMDNLMWAFSSKVTLVPFVLFTLWIVYRRNGWRGVMFSVLAMAIIVLIADQGSGIFKRHLPKLRPTHEPLLEGMVHTVKGYMGGLYGTVSAHAANSFAIAFFTSKIVDKKWYSIIVYICCILIIYSRIYLGVHYPLDILFGTILGLVTGWLIYKLFIGYITKKSYL